MALGLLVGALASCSAERHSIGEYPAHPTRPGVLWPERDEVDARTVAGRFVAKHFAASSEPDELDSAIVGICLQEIRWDTIFRFGAYRSRGWMDIPAYFDVEFARGPTLRFKFEASKWMAFPIRGDSTDLPWECKGCLDSTFIAQLQRQCRQEN